MLTYVTHPIKVELIRLRKQYPDQEIFVTVKGGLLSSLKSLFTKVEEKRVLLYVAPSRNDNRVLPYNEDFHTIITKDPQSQQSEVVQLNRITQIRVGEHIINID
jgi:hypothetical protein